MNARRRLSGALAALCAASLLSLAGAPADAAKLLQGSVQTTISEPDPSLEIDRSPGIVGLDMVIRPATFPLVRDVFSATPAYQAGIRPGDRILAVNGQSVFGQSAWSVDQRISDVPGEMVTLTVQRQSAVRNVRLRVASLKGLPAMVRAQFLTSLY